MTETATSSQRRLPPALDPALPQLVAKLADTLGANLVSVVLYGSAARGDWDPERSDINLLIVLQVSTPEAHTALAPILFGSGLRIAPFVLGQRGLERSVRSFATKFVSIRRTSLLLHGRDLLTAIPDDEGVLRRLCEQSLRNHRLRAVQAYLRSGGHGDRYAPWISDIAGKLLSELTTAARLGGVSVSGPFADRLPALATAFGLDRVDLEALVIANHTAPTLATPGEVLDWHRRIYGILDRVLLTLEEQWPLP